MPEGGTLWRRCGDFGQKKLVFLFGSVVFLCYWREPIRKLSKVMVKNRVVSRFAPRGFESLMVRND